MSTSSGEFDTLQPILRLALAQSGFGAGYIYRFDRVWGAGLLIAFAGPRPAATSFDGTAAVQHSYRKTPVVLPESAWEDPRFGPLPEFRGHRYESVISIALRDAGVTVGMANLCRAEATAINLRDLGLMLELSRPLGALVTMLSLREELGPTAKRIESCSPPDPATRRLHETMGSRCSEEEKEEAFFLSGF
jgi:hypothetical protein